VHRRIIGHIDASICDATNRGVAALPLPQSAGRVSLDFGYDEPQTKSLTSCIHGVSIKANHVGSAIAAARRDIFS
jgi:hypothetical protein